MLSLSKGEDRFFFKIRKQFRWEDKQLQMYSIQLPFFLWVTHAQKKNETVPPDDGKISKNSFFCARFENPPYLKSGIAV